MIFIYSWITSFITLIIIDGLWLTFMGPRFYIPHLGKILSGTFNLPLVGLFYFIYSFGLAYLILVPALGQSPSLNIHVFIRGAVLGLLSYSAYNLTNQATMSSWPTVVSIVDTLWGSGMTGFVVLISYVLLLRV